MASLTVADVVEQAHATWRTGGREPDAWKREFHSLLADVVDSWCLTLDAIFPEGGATSPVLAVTTADGAPAVLKLGPPEDLGHQLSLMLADRGVSHARVLRHDADAVAMLTERLGPHLHEVIADPFEQYEIQALLLRGVWRLPVRLGVDIGSKAARLAGHIADLGPRYAEDWPRLLGWGTELATWLQEDEAPRVVVHGDPHSANMLQRADGSFAFIDPDGFLGEPEYDLGVVARGAAPIILEKESASPGAGRAFLEDAFDLLATATATATDRDRIAAWSHLERITTGIYMRWLGWEGEGLQMLASAETVRRRSE